MELLEFLLILTLNIILLIITLIRKGALFSFLGMMSCLFFIPYTLANPLILEHVYFGNSTNLQYFFFFY